MLRTTPEMGEDQILQACAEAVLETSLDSALEQSALERGYASTFDLIKASMKEERDQYDTLEGRLATLLPEGPAETRMLGEQNYYCC